MSATVHNRTVVLRVSYWQASLVARMLRGFALSRRGRALPTAARRCMDLAQLVEAQRDGEILALGAMVTREQWRMASATYRRARRNGSVE